MTQKKKDTIKSLAIHSKDVGSTEIQIGLLTDFVKPTDECLSFLELLKCSASFDIFDVSKPI